MNAYIYRYGSICEPDIIASFERIGLTVIEETTEISRKNLSNAERVQIVESNLKRFRPLFVFSINFYPAIAEICQIYQTPYICWTVDSPVPELFSESIHRSTNRIFLFDRAQYETFSAYNPNCIFHLPLASATDRFDKVISSITEVDRKNYSKEIAFIGSLYNEKSPLTDIKGLSEYSRGYLDALEDASLKIYGYNFTEAALNDKIIQEIQALDPSFYNPGKAIAPSARYVAAHNYVGMEIAVKERLLTLKTLAEYFPVDLYTRSDTKDLMAAAAHKDASPNLLIAGDSISSAGLQIHGGVASLTEMPKIFHLSKINLNMTIKPIQKGLPLRIFDILGCGGFCMTNYQSELDEQFEIGTDLEAYVSLEELVDKCAYYLSHDEERARIARNGYEKVKHYHTYQHRIKAMLENAPA